MEKEKITISNNPTINGYLSGNKFSFNIGNSDKAPSAELEFNLKLDNSMITDLTAACILKMDKSINCNFNINSADAIRPIYYFILYNLDNNK